jgi:hypothetical protein
MRRFLRRLQPATLLAVAALVIAVSGGAPAITASAEDAVSAARQLITGEDVKRGAIGSRHVKNRTLRLRDLTPAAVRSLAEEPGGDAFAGTFGSTNIPANGMATPFRQTLGPGSYVFIANLRALSVSNDATIVDCNLVAGGQQLDEKFLSLRAGDTTVLTLVATTTLTAQGPMTLSCEASTGTGYQVDHGQVVAIQVAEINPPQGGDSR